MWGKYSLWVLATAAKTAADVASAQTTGATMGAQDQTTVVETTASSHLRTTDMPSNLNETAVFAASFAGGVLFLAGVICTYLKFVRRTLGDETPETPATLAGHLGARLMESGQNTGPMAKVVPLTEYQALNGVDSTNPPVASIVEQSDSTLNLN